jgi:hypothetical protein
MNIIKYQNTESLRLSFLLQPLAAVFCFFFIPFKSFGIKIFFAFLIKSFVYSFILFIKVLYFLFHFLVQTVWLKWFCNLNLRLKLNIKLD